MDYSVYSREFEHDYAWDNSHASDLLAEYAQEKFAPAFEGSLTTSRFTALLRCAGSPHGVIMCVSTSTTRMDNRHRPIRTMAFIRAENPDEERILAAFFAECLRNRDEETLYNTDSGVAKAVESLCRTKNADEFVQFCKALQPVSGNGSAPKKRFAFPRSKDEGERERQALANALSTVIAGDSPFLFALTDRSHTDVLGSLGSMFDHALVRIFSEAVDHCEYIPEPGSQKYRYAAAIGGAVILVLLVAAIGTCSRGSRQDEAKKNSTGGETNASSSSRQVSAASVRPIPPAVTNAPAQEAAVTNAPPPSQNGSDGPVTSVPTNAPPKETAVTNSLKSASARAEREKPENE